MHRLFALATLATLAAALAVVPACSYLWEVTARADQDALTLDETTPEQRFAVTVCWDGAAEVDDVELTVLASSADPSGRVQAGFADDQRQVQTTQPEPIDAPGIGWSSYDDTGVEVACMTGAELVFTLDTPAEGPAEVEWQLHAYVSSTSDSSVEELELMISVEPL